ncbi:MAG TPA: hypothetical protein VLT33_03870 [Labilithrix sp.]|nr:hypothetical protein [Labilithrix sp.]
MSKSRIIGGFVAVLVVASGCSSAPEPPAKKSGSATTDKSPATPTPTTGDGVDTSPTGDPVDCVPAGTKPNDKGVGAYCQASSECTQGTFCTAGLAPKGAEFCTTFCSSDADCGAGATCYTDARGRACVPAACVGSK